MGAHTEEVTYTQANPQLRGLTTGLFGVLLWLQFGASTLSRELSYAAPSTARILLFVSPLFALALGLLLRNRFMSLVVVVATNAAVVIAAPPDLKEAIADPTSFVFLAATLLAYVFSCATWLNSPQQVQAVVIVERKSLRPFSRGWAPYQGRTLPRVVVLGALFVGMALVVPLVPELADGIRSGFEVGGAPHNAEQAVILVNLIQFFAWCVLAFSYFLVPDSELRHTVRDLEKKTRGRITRAQSARRRFLFYLTVLMGLGLMGLLVWLRSL